MIVEPLPVELMNTRFADRDGVHDALTSDGKALAWLRAVGPRLAAEAPAVGRWLASDPADPAGLGEAVVALRGVRDGLRALAAARTGDPRAEAVEPGATVAEALAVVNAAAAAVPARPVLSWTGGAEFAATTVFDGAPGQTAAALFAREGIAMFAARADLRACLAPGCVLYFVKEHTRREWCSAGCGNRARVARHYRRHRTP